MRYSLTIQLRVVTRGCETHQYKVSLDDNKLLNAYFLWIHNDNTFKESGRVAISH